MDRVLPLLRAATADDAGAIAEVYAPYVRDTSISFETEPPDAAEIRARMLAEPRLPWLVATRGDVVTGYAYASRHRARAAYRWSVEVSVYLLPEEQGRGTARRLYDALLAELVDLGYVSAYAGITQPNPASTRLHAGAGFIPAGVFRDVGHKGGWHDVAWWQRTLRSPPDDPEEPRPWPGTFGSSPTG